MSKLQSLVSKTAGVMSRSVMRTGSIILRRRARLEALSAAINWFVKRNHCRPLQITHESDYGDVHIMSDGKRIELTWWINDKAQPDEAGHTSSHGNLHPDTHANGSTKCSDCECIDYGNGATPNQTRQGVAVAASGAAISHVTSTESSIGEAVGEEVGDAVGDFIGEVVEAAIDDVVEHVFDGNDDDSRTSSAILTDLPPRDQPPKQLLPLTDSDMTKG